MPAAVCSSMKRTLWGVGESLHRVLPRPRWAESSGMVCHPHAPVVCIACLALRDAAGTWQEEGRGHAATRCLWHLQDVGCAEREKGP